MILKEKVEREPDRYLDVMTYPENGAYCSE